MNADQVMIPADTATCLKWNLSIASRVWGKPGKAAARTTGPERCRQALRFTMDCIQLPRTFVVLRCRDRRLHESGCSEMKSGCGKTDLKGSSNGLI